LEHRKLKFFLNFLIGGALLMATPTQVTVAKAGTPLEGDGLCYVTPYPSETNGHNVPVLCVHFQDESRVGHVWGANISDVGRNISLTYHPKGTVHRDQEVYLFGHGIVSSANTPDQQKYMTSIPEPVSLALVGGALLAFGSFFRYRPTPQAAAVHVSE
jgi:hypothetical protein